LYAYYIGRFTGNTAVVTDGIASGLLLRTCRWITATSPICRRGWWIMWTSSSLCASASVSTPLASDSRQYLRRSDPNVIAACTRRDESADGYFPLALTDSKHLLKTGVVPLQRCRAILTFSSHWMPPCHLARQLQSTLTDNQHFEVETLSSDMQRDLVIHIGATSGQ
jgi:hypothetical protein